jgi:enoyl-CoA hydratase/carnithine racemase
MTQNIIAKQKLFLNADKSELVAEGDERAAFLFCTKGDEITPETHKQFGLVDGALPEKSAAKKPKAATETKPVAAAETKDA